MVEKWLVVVFEGITGSLPARDSQACVHRLLSFFFFFFFDLVSCSWWECSVFGRPWRCGGGGGAAAAGGGACFSVAQAGPTAAGCPVGCLPSYKRAVDVWSRGGEREEWLKTDGELLLGNKKPSTVHDCPVRLTGDFTTPPPHQTNRDNRIESYRFFFFFFFFGCGVI